MQVFLCYLLGTVMRISLRIAIFIDEIPQTPSPLYNLYIADIVKIENFHPVLTPSLKLISNVLLDDGNRILNPQGILFFPISSETKLGVFELPFVHWSVSLSVSQSVSHTFVRQTLLVR